MNFRAIQFRTEGSIAFLRFNRPKANNTINRQMVDEVLFVLENRLEGKNVLVFEGNQEVFCFGADFVGMGNDAASGVSEPHEPQRLYAIWERMTAAPVTIISHVKGKTNAGGMGFVAASDIVLSSLDAQFSLSELIFDLMPACVLPFLIRRVGYQRAHFLALSTQPIDAQLACRWGLVDLCEADSDALLRKQLLRLRHLSREGIGRHKSYINRLAPLPFEARELALAENQETFSNERTLQNIYRFASTGAFPWERE